MLCSRAERPGRESLCASCCTPQACVEPAPPLTCVSPPAADSECPQAPCRARDPLQWLCHPPGCRAGQEAFLTPWLYETTSCSVDRLRTDKISWIYRSAGAGWGDPSPSSWFTLLCFCLEEQRRLRGQAATPGALAEQPGWMLTWWGFDFMSTADPRVVIFPTARQSCSLQPWGRRRSLKKPAGLLSPHLHLPSSATQPGCPKGK